MGFFSKSLGAVFLKENNETQKFIEKLQELRKSAEGDIAKKIENQISIAKYGKIGEENIAFELKNSGVDMYVLQDIYLESGNMSAQIDYLVITRHHIYVLECKNLIGNIEIDYTGAFIRSYNWGGKYIREGIYSPITQNERHLQVIKELQKSNKRNLFSKMIFEKNFEEIYRPIVVLANPKTCLNARYAHRQIKDQVIRADQLITYIKRTDADTKKYKWNNKIMLETAYFFLNENREQRPDYSKKFEEMVCELAEYEARNKRDTQEILYENREEKIRKLKEFRLRQSRLENIKPYYIFNDAQMNDLLDKFPHNKKELLNVAGFGSVKAEKYGEEILKILWEKK